MQFFVLDSILARVCLHPMDWFLGLACRRSSGLIHRLAESERELEASHRQLSVMLFEFVGQNKDPRLRLEALELKRELSRADTEAVASSELQCQMSSHFRSLLTRYIQLRRQARESRSAVLAEFETEFLETRMRFRSLLTDPTFQEGVLLSSRKLYDSMIRYLSKPFASSKGTKDERQLERNLIQHLARSTGKTVPRGTLAGISQGSWKAVPASQPKISITTDSLKRRTWLNLVALRQLSHQLSWQGMLWLEVIPRANPTMIERDGRYFFWKDAGAQEELSLAALPQEGLIREMIELANPRTLTARAILERLGRVHEGEFTGPELHDYYRKLCKLGLIVGDFEIPFESGDGLSTLLNWLENISGDTMGEEENRVLTALREAKQRIAILDHEPSAEKRIPLYCDLETFLRTRVFSNLPDIRNWGLSDLIVIDSAIASPDAFTLGKNVRDKFDKALNACALLNAAAQTRFNPAENAASMLKRWGFELGTRTEHQERAVWDLIESGGKLNPALANSRAALPATQDVFTKLFLEWLASKRGPDGNLPSSLDLQTDGLLDAVTRSIGKPKSLAPFGASEMVFRVCAQGTIVMEAMPNNLGPLFTRYLDLLGGTELKSEVALALARLRSVVEPDALWADCAALPGNKADTSVSYPATQALVIEADSVRSSRDWEEVIPLRELWIRLGTGGLQLFWKRGESEKRIHPWFCSVMATNNSNPPVRLLRAMGGSIGPSLFFWLKDQFFDDHAPRITLGEVVLQRERWKIRAIDLPKLEKIRSDPALIFIEWNIWRRRRGISRHVFAEVGSESRLWIDFENPFSLDAITSSIRSQQPAVITFVEMFPAADETLTSNDGLKHAVQFVTGVIWENE